MAGSSFVAHFITLSLLTISLHSPHALSRSLQENIPTYTLLDVSASFQKTCSVFSLKPPKWDEQKQTTSPLSSSSSLSLELRPRISLRRSSQHEEDYKSLIQSRLARDSERVKILLAKLDLAIWGISMEDLKPDPNSAESTQLGAEDLSTPVSSGTSQGSGEYFSRVGIGSPEKEFFMVVDTGSDLNWLQCEPCTDCYSQADPIFNPASSSTYSPLACDTPQCSSLQVSGCRDNTCLYQVSYGDGSYTVGDFVTETLSFQPSASIGKVAIGCGHDNNGLFVGAAGLLGLGGGQLSLPSQLKATSLSYCLVDRDSDKSSTLEFNSLQPNNSVVAPLIKNSKLDTFYYVGLTGMSVGGQMLSIPSSLFALGDAGSGGVIVDSGTAVTRLPTEAYNSLRDAFVRLTRDLPSTSGVAIFDTCYDFSSMTSVKVPTVSLHFAGGEALDLPANNYLVPVDSSRTFCFAFAPTTSSMSIIGNIQQQGVRVHFDLAKSQVSFSQNSC
ncbi:hypothetical protein Nepgr_002912 [Nepenthes gracilis]|uniref:Peptidase A1 domain-containing protein n=1 Tax=Nepenthes gracilis TaxID=150966 RepID=A0AAD3P9F2_NEPGR|nr:hypothetical protein Nepgr_002912 [Nepenthes gracilis]